MRNFVTSAVTMKIIVLVSVLALACGAPQKRLQIPRLDGRIVGGSDVEIEDRPYQISLLYYGSHICGGSTIGNEYIVTAAHCTYGSTASSLSIRAGSSIRNSGGVVIQVAEIIEHGNFSYTTLDFDISVLRLASPLEFGKGISPIKLADEGQHFEAGTETIVPGWGTLSESGSLPLQLQDVRIPLVSIEDCRKAYGEEEITDRMLCAGLLGVGGKDACQGDSGGPLVVETGNSYTLVGVVSWGYGCARPSHPGVYSCVAALRRFVKETAGI